MGVKQLESPCWKPCAPGEAPGSGGRHWDRREVADDYAEPGATALPFPAPCWTVVCDGIPGEPCGETMDDEDECWIVHLESPGDAPGSAENNGWEIDSDGTVHCYQCIEALAEVARTFSPEEGADR